MRQFLIKATLLFISLAMASALAEIALRVSHYGEANRTPLQRLTQYDPLLGWRHKPNASSEFNTSEYRLTVKYNAEGLRGPNRPFAKPPGAFRIVVLGDSFADGYTVPLADRFTEVLEANLRSRFEVINLGVAGYSTDQELLLLEQEGWKYQPDLVILAFYYNDVWGNGSKYFSNSPRIQKPLFVSGADGLLTLRNTPVPYPSSALQDRFKLYDLVRTTIKSSRAVYSLAIKAGLADGILPDAANPSPTGAAGGSGEFAVYHLTESTELAREWSITQALLHKMNQETEQHGARLLILYVPTRIELSPTEWSGAHLPPDYDPSVVGRRLVKICQAEGIPYLDPSDRLVAPGTNRFYYPRDPHWNAAGHHLVGEILADYIRNTPTRAMTTNQWYTLH